MLWKQKKKTKKKTKTSKYRKSIDNCANETRTHTYTKTKNIETFHFIMVNMILYCVSLHYTYNIYILCMSNDGPNWLSDLLPNRFIDASLHFAIVCFLFLFYTWVIQIYLLLSNIGSRQHECTIFLALKWNIECIDVSEKKMDHIQLEYYNKRNFWRISTGKKWYRVEKKRPTINIEWWIDLE